MLINLVKLFEFKQDLYHEGGYQIFITFYHSFLTKILVLVKGVPLFNKSMLASYHFGRNSDTCRLAELKVLIISSN